MSLNGRYRYDDQGVAAQRALLVDGGVLRTFLLSRAPVYNVDAKIGEETLVGGVEIVGTPLTSINKIVATGTEMRVFNGYCGAESGFVPVSTVAPAILISEIELQRTPKDTGRPPVLPSRWAGPPVTVVTR